MSGKYSYENGATNLTKVVLYQMWFLTMLSYRIYSNIAYYLHLILKSLKSKILFKISLDEFKSEVISLPKVPTHVALSFQSNLRHGKLLHNLNMGPSTIKIINLEKVAMVTAWMICGCTPSSKAIKPDIQNNGNNKMIISLYDYYGYLKDNQFELEKLIMEKVDELNRSSEMREDFEQLEIFFPTEKNFNDLDNLTGSEAGVHVHLYSQVDGKPKIMNCVKDTFIQSNNHRNQQKDMPRDTCVVKVVQVAEYLKKEVASEPDLLMSFGGINSTIDFLPWHVKLTELHWLPSVNHVQPEELLISLKKFAKCEQRFGK